MGMEKAAIFDLDGVLLNSEDNLDWLTIALKKTLETFNIDPIEENINKIHSKNVHNFQKISEEFCLPLDHFWKTRNAHYIGEKKRAMKEGSILPFEDVYILNSLKQKFKLGIISNSPQEVVNFFLKEFGYNDLFDFSIGRGGDMSDLNKMKPNSYFFKKLKEHFRGSVFFYVGDSENDRLFALKTGMKFLYLSRKNHSSKDGFRSLFQIVDYLLLQ